MEKNIFIGIIVIFLVFAGVQFYTSVIDSFMIGVVRNCKVKKLHEQQIINGNKSSLSTEIRYLVITDKETFICKSSLLNGKFNNSDIFFHLKEGNVYSFKVSGNGKSVLTDYRNILEIVE